MTSKCFADQCHRCNRRGHKVKDCQIPRRKQTKQQKGDKKPEIYNIGWIANLRIDIPYSQKEEAKSNRYLKKLEDEWDNPSEVTILEWKNFLKTNTFFKPKETKEADQKMSNEELINTLKNQ